ncbi:MAG: hypothetical protein GY865_08755 [candidate division Zixibacteria bacterium]|nr:hypothetical protein [candidate division Zixibacteria bacterium]
MKNCELMNDPNEILSLLFHLLSESQIRLEIDHPIDESCARFIPVEANSSASNDLLVQAGRFIQHLYASGIRPLQYLSEKEALIEAFYLLEHLYQGTEGSGYISALIEFNKYEHEDRITVLRRLAESIKAQKREKYVRLVFSRYYYLHDTEIKEKVIELLFQKKKSSIREELLQCRPFQLIGYFPTIIQTCLSVDANIQKMMNNS